MRKLSHQRVFLNLKMTLYKLYIIHLIEIPEDLGLRLIANKKSRKKTIRDDSQHRGLKIMCFYGILIRDWAY